MLTKPQQSVYRPLVEKAWLEHCRLEGLSPNNKPAKETWYRDQVHSATGLWSTRDADPTRDYQTLLDRFMLLAGDPQPIIIKGWTQSQTSWFSKEARKSFDIGRTTGLFPDDLDFNDWVSDLLLSHGIMGHHATDRRESFDKVMAELATISGDDHLIDHFSQATEIRVRWGITQYMSDLSWLEKTPVTWEYVRAIWTQSSLLPDLAEAPSAILIKVLQMLDTHIRRLCKRLEIRPKCLPTRCNPDTCKGDCRCPEGVPAKYMKGGSSEPPSEVPF
ncbi:MAG: hypothetical protein WCS52_02160 [bacterium]